MLERLTADMITAMKNKDKLTLSVIRMVKGAIQLEEINKREKLEDDDIIGIVGKQIKIRKESIEEFKKANRIDLVDQAEAEMDILNKYLPAQLSDDEISKLIQEVITKVDAKVSSDMGKVMKELMPLIKGKADMSKVSAIIKEKLQ